MARVTQHLSALFEGMDSVSMKMNYLVGGSSGNAATRSPSCTGDEESCTSECYQSCDESFADYGEEAASAYDGHVTTRPIAACIPAEYPADLIVRNTFLDFESAFLDGFHVRRVQSAPCSPVSRHTDGDDDTLNVSTLGFSAGMWQQTPSSSVALAPLAPKLCDAPMAIVEARIHVSGESSTLEVTSALSCPIASALERHVVVSELDSSAMPSVGSMLHHRGECKPCAFFWKQGCVHAVDCVFCHLCDSSEKKKRQKEKKAAIKEFVRRQHFSSS